MALIISVVHADPAKELRDRLNEFLARCVLAERAGIDPTELERIAARVVILRERRSAQEALKLIEAAEEELEKVFPL